MQLKTLNQQLTILDKNYTIPKTLKLDLPTFDRNTGGLREGKLYIWGAPTGSGKTTAMIALAVRALERMDEDERLMFIATEQEANEIGVRFLASLTGIPHQDIYYHNYTDEQYEILQKAQEKLEKVIFLFYEDTSFDIIKTVEEASKMGVKYVFFDYIGAIPDINDGQEWKSMIFNADRLKKAAQLNKTFVMAAIQCNISARQAEEAPPEYMDESYFSMSKGVATKADEAAILIRPKDKLNTQGIRIYNIKNRDMKVDPYMEFNLDYSTCQIFEVEKQLFTSVPTIFLPNNPEDKYNVGNIPQYVINDEGTILTFEEAIKYIKNRGKSVKAYNMLNHLNGKTKTCGGMKWQEYIPND